MSDQSNSSSSSSTSSSSESDDEETLLRLQELSTQMEVKPGVTTNRFLGTGLVYDEIFTKHQCEWDTAYPENPRRLLDSYARCYDLGLVQRCIKININYAMEDQITTVHSADLVTTAQSTAEMSMEQHKELAAHYDGWYVNSCTYEASLAAAGSTLSLVDHILDERVDNGFAMVRPPGHHAMHNEFNGYCTFNNVGIGAERALARGISKILIVDWDAHHGQGLQRHFYKDRRVLYFSIHRYEHGQFWPELRESDYDYVGEGDGAGYNVNVPLNKTGMTNADYMAVMNQVLLPLAYEFNPEMVFVSSGYDAAVGCPEGEMLLTPAMYAHMTHHLLALATGRVCVVLEGGYFLQSLAEGCALTLRSLLQDPCPKLDALGEPSESMICTILNVVKVLRPYWKCFSFHQLLLPNEECEFKEVMTTPPVPGIVFSTEANRPEIFPIKNDYPIQDKGTIEHFSTIISKLIRTTDLSKPKHKCCYVFDSDMRGHKDMTMKSHPECPERISCIYAKLGEMGFLKRMLQVESRLARKEELLLIHTDSHVAEMASMQDKSQNDLNRLPNQKYWSSIYLNQKSLYCALLSCGSLLSVTEAVCTGQSQSGVAIVRPPGHHAESHCPMGFCIFNNVAVAAKLAQKEFNINKILILDWDVHHGNATQHQFYNDPSVLYISLHRYDFSGFFPGSNEADTGFVGEGPGEGYNVNIPWNVEKMGDPEYLAAFTQIVMPIAYQFAPDLVFISAGFDAAFGDPLGGYKLTPLGYAHMTHMLSALANGRVVLALEGGYNLDSMSACMAACTSVLLGDHCPSPPSQVVPCARAIDTINKVLGIQKKYWSSLKFHTRIPDVKPQQDQLKKKQRAESARPRPSSCRPKQNIQRPGSSRSTLAQRSQQSFDQFSFMPISDPIEDQGQKRPSIKPILPVDPNNVSNWPPPKGSNATDHLAAKLEAVQLSTSKALESDLKSLSFRSNLYSNKPDPEPLLRSLKPWGASEDSKKSKQRKEKQSRAEARRIKKEEKRLKKEEKKQLHDCIGSSATSGSDVAKAESAIATADIDEAALGACGGSVGSTTVEEFLKMQGADQMFAVKPLTWCPHLVEIKPMPECGLNTADPCATCGDTSENWVCLTCYTVECSRYVNEHMLFHKIDSDHNMTLSYSDLSIWCYACDHYVDNPAFFQQKSSAHKSKFGQPL